MCSLTVPHSQRSTRRALAFSNPLQRPSTNTPFPRLPPPPKHNQDGNYPLGSGSFDDIGVGAGEGFTINVPLPPGSGSGAYRGAFERIVMPALDAFEPQIIFASAGYDAGYMDPLGHMMCSSDDFRCCGVAWGFV